jgi:putative ABC transport system ATP-binding protein
VARTYGPGMALVDLQYVTKRYDNGAAPAVADVNLTVAAGEATAIMGPSGSGKSTLLNLIAGMDRPTSGTVRVGDQQVDKLSETRVARFRRRHVGMIFQFFNLLDDLTVLDNVLLPAQLAGTRSGAARARAGSLRRWPGRAPAHPCRRQPCPALTRWQVPTRPRTPAARPAGVRTRNGVFGVRSD